MQGLRDELGLIIAAAESQQAAVSVSDTAGIYLVPVFTGRAPPSGLRRRGGLLGKQCGDALE